MNDTVMNDTTAQSTLSVRVSDLSLTYPKHAGTAAFTAVEGVSFDLATGSVLAVLGESGSGKSTLTRFLAGRSNDPSDRSARVKLTSGAAEVLDTPLGKLSRRSKDELTARIGYVAQDAGAVLPPDINVGEMFFEPVFQHSKDVDRDAIGNDIAEMMNIVDLPLTKLQEYAHELSKGQRQRVAVMRSLMLAPELLIADEPTLGIDANNRPKIVQLLDWYRKRTGASMILITHDIGLLETLTHQVIVMQNARLVGSGDINEVFRNADHHYVQQLAGALRSNAYDEVAEA